MYYYHAPTQTIRYRSGDLVKEIGIAKYSTIEAEIERLESMLTSIYTLRIVSTSVVEECKIRWHLPQRVPSIPVSVQNQIKEEIQQLKSIRITGAATGWSLYV